MFGREDEGTFAVLVKFYFLTLCFIFHNETFFQDIADSGKSPSNRLTILNILIKVLNP